MSETGGMDGTDGMGETGGIMDDADSMSETGGMGDADGTSGTGDMDGTDSMGGTQLSERKRTLRRSMKRMLRTITAEQRQRAARQLVEFGETRGWLPVGASRPAGPTGAAGPPGDINTARSGEPSAPGRRADSGARVFAFASTAGELNTWPLLQALWACSRSVYLPRVEGSQAHFCRVGAAEELSRGAHGILEPPAGGPAQTPQPGDVVLVPGLAFSPGGARLGRGGGYYDRLLAELPEGTRTIGIGFHLQIVEHVPMGPWDRPVDELATFG